VYGLNAIKSARVIVDGGAHIGIFSIIAAHKSPNATVFAIEPEERNCNQLCANIELNGLSNVRPIRAALDQTHGTKRLFISDCSVNHSLTEETDKSVEVQTLSLFHFGHMDVFKLDVEGAEYDILKTLPDCQYLTVEVHLSPDKEDLLKASLCCLPYIENVDDTVYLCTKLA